MYFTLDCQFVASLFPAASAVGQENIGLHCKLHMRDCQYGTAHDVLNVEVINESVRSTTVLSAIPRASHHAIIKTYWLAAMSAIATPFDGWNRSPFAQRNTIETKK